MFTQTVLLQLYFVRELLKIYTGFIKNTSVKVYIYYVPRQLFLAHPLLVFSFPLHHFIISLFVIILELVFVVVYIISDVFAASVGEQPRSRH